MGKWKFSLNSQRHLYTCHPELVETMTRALETSPVDFGISCGHRDRIAQDKVFLEGASKLKWPDSKHNMSPSDAVDFFPVIGNKAIWGDAHLFYLIAGVVLGLSHNLGYRLRWGGAWYGTLNLPGVFNDLPHIERLI